MVSTAVESNDPTSTLLPSEGMMNAVSSSSPSTTMTNTTADIIHRVENEVDGKVKLAATGEVEVVEEEEQVESDAMMIIQDLYILPPRQTPTAAYSKGPTTTTTTLSPSSFASPQYRYVIALPPLRYDEQVQSIRVALMDIMAYAHYTNYRLELEMSQVGAGAEEAGGVGVGGVPFNTTNDINVAFTGKEADICIPVQYLPYSTIATTSTTNTDTPVVLDEYGDLHSIGPHVSEFLETIRTKQEISPSTTATMIGLRIVLERYTMSTLREQIQRCKYLLSSGQLPTITTLYEPAVVSESTPQPPTEAEEDSTNENVVVAVVDPNATTITTSSSTTTTIATTNEANDTPSNGNHTATATTTTTTTKAPTLPDFQSIPNIVVDGTNLQDFFYLIFGEDRDMVHRDTTTATESPISNISGSNDPSMTLPTTTNNNNNKTNTKSHHKKNKKHHKNGTGEKYSNGTTSSSALTTVERNTVVDTVTNTATTTIKQQIQRYNELDELSRCTSNVTIQYSGYHPPPTHRKLLGDLAYLMITIPTTTTTTTTTTTHHDNTSKDGKSSNNHTNKSTIVHITCTACGFYVNKTVDAITFDPSPATPESHFSHTLLDCLLSVSSDLKKLWTIALNAAKERNEMATTTTTNSIYQSIFRTAIRGDFDGFRSNISAIQMTKEAYDATITSPTWMVPSFSKYIEKQDQQLGWNHNACHNYNVQRTEDELQRTYGMIENLRNGTITRDWNEELQTAREMPVSTAQERLDRARLIHKVMMEFGEASLHGVMAIANGQVLPMNPNESIRSQVFLINNIFVSRGVDTGPETFKITRGDRAARKASNRDLQCIGIFHRLENNNPVSNLHTLATVLIDYLGTRYVCQSILPGILIGDKSHTLLYGSVDAGIPLKSDDELEKNLEEKLGPNFMIASRPIYRCPLSLERMTEIEQQRKSNVIMYNNSYGDSKKGSGGEDADTNEILQTCVAIEAKGILGSDQRRYMLDISRLTPRDANWVPKENGGSGKFEEIQKMNKQKSSDDIVPVSLEDDEWVMCVLRPELITRYAQLRMKQFIDGQSKDKEIDETESPNSSTNGTDEMTTLATEETPESNGADTAAHLQNLKFNVNVFIPYMRQMTDTTAAEQIKDDEKLVRDISTHLWDDVLPKITMAVREGAVNQLPVDGKSLTEFLHRNGVNCRYLGRLAMLAQEQEEKDGIVEAELKLGNRKTIERKTMPRCWLEMLECEMLARAAKHVLDEYLTVNGGVAALQPAQTIASFLSALISESEETAAQTETRYAKRSGNEADDDDYAALTIVDVGGNGDAVPSSIKSRSEVWRDIEIEIGRRFRYHLVLFNRDNKSHRALYVPLLRRVCQRTGVILSAKPYAIGGKCMCGGGSSMNGRILPSFPISPLDIVDVMPLMKHTAAYHEGFQLCSVGTTSVSLPPLQISLPDARAILERAHIQASGRALGRALELAQEAGSLYQRVTDNAAHPGVIESIDLMSTIFFEAGDTNNAVVNSEKALTLTLQSGGLDSAAAFNAHQLLFQMLFTAHDMERAVKHLRASMYILELMAGPHHTEQYSAYHKLGTVYSYPDYNGKYLPFALECFQETRNRESCDRLMDGFMAKNFARTYMGMENFIDALDYERKANHSLTMFLGKNHKMTLESDTTLQVLSRLALEKGTKSVANDTKSNHPTNTQPAVVDLEAAAMADLIAADLVAEEERSSNKKKGDKKKRGKK